jgi:hypothetical protein
MPSSPDHHEQGHAAEGVEDVEQQEVERLRARVAELEQQLAVSPEGRQLEPADGGGPVRRSRGWAVLSAVLIVLGCVLAPLSVTSVWASTVISDTDQYVETVAPLAEDPALQRAVADEVTETVFEYVDVEALTTEAIDTLASQENAPPRLAAALPALTGPIVNGVEEFTADRIDEVVASPQFAEAWVAVNRVAHEQVVTLLEGNQGGAVSAQGDTVTLNLGPIVALVKERLVAQGFTLAENIPAVNRSFVLVQSEGITQAQGFYRLINTLGVWLPFVALGLLAAGVLIAADKRRALLRGSLGVVAAMVALGVALAVGRVLYIDAVPADVLTPAAAGTVFDTLVRFLRTGLRALAVLGLVVALDAFLTGPSVAATRTRSALEGGIGSMRGGAEAAGFRTGRFGGWVFAHKRVLRYATVIGGGLTLLFWDQPTGWVVVTVALVVLAVLAVVEFLGRPPAPEAAPPVVGEEAGARVLEPRSSADNQLEAAPVDDHRTGTGVR